MASQERHQRGDKPARQRRARVLLVVYTVNEKNDQASHKGDALHIPPRQVVQAREQPGTHACALPKT